MEKQYHMAKIDDYTLSKKELKEIQKSIAELKVTDYVKKNKKQPEGDLSEFFRITEDDIARRKIYKFCHHFVVNHVENSTYFVERSITNAVSSNNYVTIMSGESFSTIITPVDGYEILREHVHISMGGKDITDSVWANNTIEINEVTGDIVIAIIATTKTHCDIITNIDEHTHFVGDTTPVQRGTQYTASITPNEGYTLKRVQILMNGIDITESVYHDGEINIQYVDGDICIICETVIITFTVTLNGSHVSISELSSHGSVFEYGEAFNGEVTLAEHYDLIGITVQMGNVDITEAALSGMHISISSITDNVSIIVLNSLHKYDVIYEYVGDTPKTEYGQIEYGSTLLKTISIEPGVGLYLCECVVGERQMLFPQGNLSMPNIDDTVYVHINKHTIPDDEILYFNVDGEVENNFVSSNIISNTIVNGVGILKFAEAVTDTNGIFSSQSLRVSKVFLPNSVGNNIHFSNSTIKSVHLPATTTEIPSSGFNHCIYLTEVKGMENVVTIGNNAFIGIKSITLSNLEKLETIGSYAFANVTSSVTLSNLIKLETIGNSAFSNTQYVHLYGVESLKTISSSAFSCQGIGRGSLTLTFTNNMPNGNISVGTYAFQNRQINSSIIQKIGSFSGTPMAGAYISGNILDLTFCNVLNLSSFFISASVISCQTLKLGSSTNIGDFFNYDYASSITSIYCYSETRPSIGRVSDKIKSRGGTLHIPQGADYSALLTALGVNWKKVEDIVLES